MENDSRIESYEVETTAPTHVLGIETDVSLGVDEILSPPSMDIKDLKIPIKYKQDIEKAVEILKKGGCESVYLYGSVLGGIIHERLGIDIGITGLVPSKFMDVYTRIYIDLETEINVKDFDIHKKDLFFLRKIKGIVKIG